jgi:hypothetical protein
MFQSGKIGHINLEKSTRIPNNLHTQLNKRKKEENWNWKRTVSPAISNRDVELKPSPYSMFSNVVKAISGIPQVAYLIWRKQY